MSRRRLITLIAVAICCLLFTVFTVFDVRRLVVGPVDGWGVAVLLLDAGLAAGYGWWVVTKLRAKAGDAK